MLSYQHSYHAGNIADVIKHLVLTHLLDYLIQKEKPLFYLETHAGRGCYDLKHKHATHTQEYKTGILPIWERRKQLPAAFSSYLHLIEKLNTSNELQTYPGSPYFAIQSLRKQDRLYFCEAHPQEYATLCQLPKQNKRVCYSKESGWHALKALLPPPERRGLIFIDPSFELKDEYQTIPDLLFSAYQRFSQGIYCLWYPMTAHHAFQTLTQKLNAIPFDDTLHLAFSLTLKKPIGLYGSGLFIVNPPYTLKQTLSPALVDLRNLIHLTCCEK